MLPTYDVFDEDRYFEPASEPQILRLEGTVFGISICEDIWNDRDFWKRRRYHADPVEELVANGAKAIINLSASPFTVGKQAHREAMLSSLARKHQVPFLYVNQVGGNDDLVFDGRSCFFDSSGSLIARGKGFEEDLVIADLGLRLRPRPEGSQKTISPPSPRSGGPWSWARATTCTSAAFPAFSWDYRGASTRASWRPWPRGRWGPKTFYACSCLRPTPARRAWRTQSFWRIIWG